MNWAWTMETNAAYRSRVRGCLLGGAIGDALGFPIEFSSIDQIRNVHGRLGVTGLVPGAHGLVGRISDDTQMTLFTAEALIEADARQREKENPGWPVLVRQAYERWLRTQSEPGPDPTAPPASGPLDGLITEAWLYARRAPGNACLSGVAQMYTPDPWLKLDGGPGQVNPDSKGCGAVMRSAPFGLVAEHDVAFTQAACAAQITHGHPTGYYAAGALAAIIANLVAGDSMKGAVLQAMWLLARHPGHEETTAALERAVEEAAAGRGNDPERVEKLGAGWVAEEALSIAVFCALHPRLDTKGKLLMSVNHSGDSDSTGAICGNLLGAAHGDHALPHTWVQQVEGRARIAMLADDLGATRIRAY